MHYPEKDYNKSIIDGFMLGLSKPIQSTTESFKKMADSLQAEYPNPLGVGEIEPLEKLGIHIDRE